MIIDYDIFSKVGIIVGVTNSITKVPTHCFITIKDKSGLLGIELTQKMNKLDISKIASNDFVFVAKPPFIEDIQDKIMQYLQQAFILSIPFNVLEMYKFYNAISDFSEFCCSRFVSLYLQWLSDETKLFEIPQEWNIRTKDWAITPTQLMSWFKGKNWLIPFTNDIELNVCEAEPAKCQECTESNKSFCDKRM